MKILLWHVHGSWTTAFVQGNHEYLLPVTPDRDADGLGRARTWSWPASVREVTPGQLANEPIDLVVLQRPHELDLAMRWTGRLPGVDLPAVYLEHNTPTGHVPHTRHPMSDQTAIPIVHVSHFNELFWYNGRAPRLVIEHGVIDPGPMYVGSVARLAVVANDPLSRGRTLGTDLLTQFVAAGGVDIFGMRVSGVSAVVAGEAGRAVDICEFEDLPQSRMHSLLAQRRVYLHLARWTSLGLSLIEAMMLGMPVVVLAATEALEAVPPEAGALSTDVSRLVAKARQLLTDPDAARAAGAVAREAALTRYGVDRFLRDWDSVLWEAVR
jgi:glycosyltransferase involved in cell wall biosynthesis